jgi:hypothetical protein
MIPSDSIARYCALAVLLMPAVGVAQTAAEKFSICEKAGDVAVATVKARDSGITVEQAKSVNASLGLEGNILALFDALVSLTYVMDGVEGPVMQQVAIQMCQKSMGLK